MKVVYLSSESFMNELIGSLRRDKMDEFKTNFRNVDLLILDDVQFIAGKDVSVYFRQRYIATCRGNAIFLVRLFAFKSPSFML